MEQSSKAIVRLVIDIVALQEVFDNRILNFIFGEYDIHHELCAALVIHFLCFEHSKVLWEVHTISLNHFKNYYTV